MLDGCLVESLVQLFPNSRFMWCQRNCLNTPLLRSRYDLSCFWVLVYPTTSSETPFGGTVSEFLPNHSHEKSSLQQGSVWIMALEQNSKSQILFVFFGGSTLYSTLFVGSWTYSGAYVGRCAFLQCPFSGAFGGCIPKQFPVKGRDGAVLKFLAWGYGLNLVEKW